jgi:hypothetical protein
MRSIVLTQSDIVPDGQNNKLVYKFPNSILFQGNSIAVSSVSMYYSWFNITAGYTNNTFTYTWTVGLVTNTYTVIIPNGLYEITDLNVFLQYEFIKNGTYLVNAAGKNVYYGEWLLNPTRYAVQINTFQVPTAAQAATLGYTAPTGFVGFPTDSTNLQFTINANLNVIMGFAPNFQTPFNSTAIPYIPSANTPLININGAGTISCLSSAAPNLQPNSSIFLSISNINNPYALPSSIIYSIVPQGAVGTLISDKPPNFSWNKMVDGTYSQLTLTFLGTNLQPLPILDPQITVILVIKDADESSGK